MNSKPGVICGAEKIVLLFLTQQPQETFGNYMTNKRKETDELKNNLRYFIIQKWSNNSWINAGIPKEKRSHHKQSQELFV